MILFLSFHIINESYHDKMKKNLYLKTTEDVLNFISGKERTNVLIVSDGSKNLNFIDYGLYKTKENVNLGLTSYNVFRNNICNDIKRGLCFTAFNGNKVINISSPKPNHIDFYIWLNKVINFTNYTVYTEREALEILSKKDENKIIVVDVDHDFFDFNEVVYRISKKILDKIDIHLEKGTYLFLAKERIMIPVNKYNITKAKYPLDELCNEKEFQTHIVVGSYLHHSRVGSEAINLLTHLKEKFGNISSFSLINYDEISQRQSFEKFVHIRPPYFMIGSLKGFWHSIHDFSDLEYYVSFFYNVTTDPENHPKTKIMAIPFPQDENTTFKEINPLTFNNSILNSSYDLFLLLASPDCTYCEEMKTNLREVSSKISSQSLKFFWFDCVANYLPDDISEYDSYPTVLLYIKGEKKAEYNGDGTVEDVLNFHMKWSQPHNKTR